MNWKRMYDDFINTLKTRRKSDLYEERYNATYTYDPAIRYKYETSWLRKKIIKGKVDDALSKGISFYGDKAQYLQDRLSALGFWSSLRMACYDARLTGGAVLLLGIEDGKQTTDPVGTVTKLSYVTFVPREDVQIIKYYDNVNAPKHRLPEMYQINSQVYHESRVVQLIGEAIYKPDLASGWGLSSLRQVDETLKSFKLTLNGVEDIITEMTFKVAKIPFFGKIMAKGTVTSEGVTETIRERMQQINNSLTTDGMVVLDAEESLEKPVVNAQGLDPIFKFIMQVTAAAADMPVTKLFGQQLGTLAGAEETTGDWVDAVKNYQETLSDILEKVFEYILSEQGGDKDFNWEWNAVRTEKPGEKVDRDNKFAQTVTNLYDSGLLSYEEARKSLADNKERSLRIDLTKVEV